MTLNLRQSLAKYLQVLHEMTFLWIEGCSVPAYMHQKRTYVSRNTACWSFELFICLTFFSVVGANCVDSVLTALNTVVTNHIVFNEVVCR